jgi:hypothetical protein
MLTTMVSFGTRFQWKSVSCAPSTHPSLVVCVHEANGSLQNTVRLEFEQVSKLKKTSFCALYDIVHMALYI